MLVRDVKVVARQWVEEEASKTPDFYGAFFVGSINWMNDDDPYPTSSDVDVKVVLENPAKTTSRNNQPRYKNIIIDGSYMSSEKFQSMETILGDYPLAAHFTKPSIILDPSGQLGRVQAIVAAEFARRQWVRKRVENAFEWALTSSDVIRQETALFHETFAWVYPVPVLAHVILVADLKNPTVRKCLVASRDVLARYDQLAFHDSMLDILGSTRMSRDAVEAHLASCEEVFDVAKNIVRTPFFQSTFISDDTRSITIDGGRVLIEHGYHREAMFWIAVVHIYCQKALDNDAPEDVQRQFAPAFERMLSDLGVPTASDRQRRIDEVKQLGPRLMEMAEIVMANNPEIVD